jgi:triphosphoribosyl-dephospho-CoA synthetase
MRRTHSPGTTSSSNPTSSAQLKNEAEETANAVKNLAKVIRDAAISTREAVKAFSDSGVVMELAESIQAAALAARDTAQGVSATTRDLHENRTAPEVASAVQQTLSSVEETGDIVNQTADQISKTAPRKTGTSVKVVNRISKSRRPTASKHVRSPSTTHKTKAQNEVKRLKKRTNMTTKVKKKKKEKKK